MNLSAYLVISGVIFGLVALLHVLRVVNSWSFQLGPWWVPMGASWIGIIVPLLLCVWAFWLASRSP
ncbi:MAG: hypothetical protein GTO40_27030 [Deltaproteobacteria bacterium]|nr:hypothetical protein [Deltaproteobacteria bacterium]